MAIDAASVPRIRRDARAVGLDPQTINTAIWTQLLEVHTAIPGIIDKFDPVKQTAEVRPAIKMLYAPDTEVGGAPQWYEPALCVDVPVVFPGNAKYMLTFPIEQGDECLLVFAERCINHWFTQGGIQEQEEITHHDASDAICIMGLRSQPNKINDFDKERMQLRNAKGDTVVTLDKQGTVTTKVKEKTAVTVKDGTITADVSGTTMVVENGKVTVKANAIKLDGNCEVTGNIDVKGKADVGGKVTGNSAAEFAGNLTGHSGADFAGDVKAEHRVSLATHVHSGVMSGGGSSGPPV